MFARVRAPGLWIFGSAIAPSEMEEFDDHQSKAIDGYGGGTWAPLTRIVIGGHGVDLTGGTAGDPLGPLTSTAAPGTGASGLVATGDGGAYGVVGVGGASGFGGHFVGAGGLIAQAASGNNYGVGAQGFGSGAGVQALGGTSSGPGGLFTAGGGNGNGVSATGTGTGYGVVGNGGGNGSGGTFTAGGGNSAGLIAQGAGSGAGLTATGGGSGAGAIVTGTGSAPGLVAHAGGSAIGAIFAYGGPLYVDQDISSTSADPQRDSLWATNIPKAWGVITTDGGGNSTDHRGMNFTATINAGAHQALDIAFTRHMADQFYDIDPYVFGSASTGCFLTRVLNKTAAGFTIQGLEVPLGGPVAGAYLDFFAAAATITFRVFGVMT